MAAFASHDLRANSQLNTISDDLLVKRGTSLDFGIDTPPKVGHRSLSWGKFSVFHGFKILLGDGTVLDFGAILSTRALIEVISYLITLILGIARDLRRREVVESVIMGIH